MQNNNIFTKNGKLDLRYVRKSIFNAYLSLVLDYQVISDSLKKSKKRFYNRISQIYNYDYWINGYNRYKSLGVVKRQNNTLNTITDEQAYLLFSEFPKHIMYMVLLNENGVFINGLGYFYVNISNINSPKIELFQTTEIRLNENILKVYDFKPKNEYNVIAKYLISRGMKYKNHSNEIKHKIKEERAISISKKSAKKSKKDILDSYNAMLEKVNLILNKK